MGSQREDKRLLKLAVDAGATMLQANAESYRVTEVVTYILKTQKGADVQVSTTAKTITAKLNNNMTMKTIEGHNTNLRHVIQVNDLSRDFSKGEITIVEAEERLAAIQGQEADKDYLWIETFKLMAYTVLLKGTLVDVVISFFIGILTGKLVKNRDKLGMNILLFSFMVTFLTSFIITVLWQTNLVTITSGAVVSASMIPHYQGTTFTNGLRDFLKTDYLAGSARIMGAAVSTIFLALGMLVGLVAGRMVTA